MPTGDQLNHSRKEIPGQITVGTENLEEKGIGQEKMAKDEQTPISVILPAYNEETAVGAEVEAIRKALCSVGMKHEIIVVDDGSDDRTAERAFQAGARVLQHPKNRGYGAALKTGIATAKYGTIAIIDADGTYPSDQIPNLVAQLKSADMVVGARTGDHVGIPLIRRPAK